ncbi:DegT/DnrJ/EryC1/StrS family aminotransferase [Elusimicrobiota bacterium]
MISLAHPILGSDEKKAVVDVIKSGIIASGKYVERFEKLSANYSKTKYAIATSSGTTALHAALLACGIKRGDKVITTPFSFIATANSILFCGAIPVFADIDPKTYNLSPEAVEKILKTDTSIKAILVVHLYGMPCDMDAFVRLKEKYKVLLIEDCAQSHGAKYKDKSVGSFGDISAFSYYATKNITTGEGGVVLTDNEKLDRSVRQIINHGRSEHSTHTVLGYNFRLTNIAASIGLAQLKKLNDWNKKRQSNALFLNKELRNVDFLQVPVIPEQIKPVFHQYTVRINSGLRSKFITYLKDNGIGAGVYYPTAIYNQPLYRELGYKDGMCPNSEKAALEVLSLPVHPALTKKNLEKIVSVIKKFKK